MNKILVLVFLFVGMQANYGQTDQEAITSTVNDYLEGTSKAKPELVRQAFHPDLNLYSVDENDKLKVWKGTDYISSFEGKEPNNRLGKILSIDLENDAAIVKAEISYPKRSLVFIDYIMLLKVAGKWTIIQKMYTRKQQ